MGSFHQNPDTEESRWFVCHTKTRCEKRFADLLKRENFEHYLPLVPSIRRYGTNVKKFTKPLFPGYVFAQIVLEYKSRAYQQDYLVRMIPVENESLFLRQLEEVKTLVDSGIELTLCPPLEKGTRVRIIAGPLMGAEAVVDDPTDPKGIVIAIDILQQGVLAHIPHEHIEVLED